MIVYCIYIVIVLCISWSPFMIVQTASQAIREKEQVRRQNDRGQKSNHFIVTEEDHTV